MTIAKNLLDTLADPSLLSQPETLVDKTVTAALSTFEVTNPATGESLATLPNFGAEQAAQMVAIAEPAQAEWAALSGKERAQILRNWYELMLANCDDLAAILTSEMGKPLAEARGEILYAASFVEWFGEEAKRIYGDIIPAPTSDKRIMVLKQPVGVVAAITPWNFPSGMITRKVGPALAVGCAVVCKPAGETPLSALALQELARRAGVPDGVFQVLTSKQGADVGVEFCRNETVRKLTFTGSTEVGRILMRQCADQIKKVSLELGGNAPFIVFDDANIDDAVEGAMISKFRNAGQTCVCANRLYVQSGVYEEFSEKLAARVAQLSVGDGFTDGVTIGPMIDQAAVDKINSHIDDAVTKGAVIVTGGSQHEKGGTFFQPTVMTQVNRDMRVAKEETFGPVAPLFRFDTVADVIAQANDTEFGLASYFYANDLTRVWRVVEALEYGMVGVNTGMISTEVAPFGGIKQSGVGREGSRYGAEEYLEQKYVCLGQM